MRLRVIIDQDNWMSFEVKLLDYGLNDYYFELVGITPHDIRMSDLKQYQNQFKKFEILEDEFHGTSQLAIRKSNISRYGQVVIFMIWVDDYIYNWKLIGF